MVNPSAYPPGNVGAEFPEVRWNSTDDPLTESSKGNLVAGASDRSAGAHQSARRIMP